MIAKKTKVLMGAGLLVTTVTAAVVSAAITDSLLRMAMDRNEPKYIARSRAKKRGKKPHAAEALLKEKAAALEACPAISEVKLKSFDGEMLTGHWYPCENARRVIVAMHGWRSPWSHDFGAIAEFWHNQGCSILFAEQRGHGNSTGEYITFGLKERFDCRDWVQWVDTHVNEEGLPIYLAGVSMGATTVLMAAGLELPAHVRGVIADCGFTSAHDIWHHVVRNNMHLNYRLRGKMVERICQKRIQCGPNSYSTLQAMQTGTTPVLFIHGTDDRLVPVTMTYQNYRACTAPKKLLIVPGADHALSYYTDPGAYEQAFVDFFAAHDGQSAAAAAAT